MPLSLDQLKERAKPWVEPISADKPAGQLARTDPAYEAILAEVAKLDSLTGGTVDWNLVVERASKLLKGHSKDLLLGCYLSSGLHATRDLEGLLTGVTVLGELLDQYWATLFPELSRLRARVNALGWFVQRTSNLLAASKAGNPEVIEALALAITRLADLTRQRFEDKGPAMGPLLEAVKRLQLAVPPPAPVPTAAPTPVAAVADATPVATPAVPSADAVTADGIGDFLRKVGASLVTAAGALPKSDPAAYRLSRLGFWLHVTEPPPRLSTGRTQVPPLPPPTRAQLDLLAANGKWPELLAESEGAMLKNRFCLDLQHHSARALQGVGPTHAPARAALILELRALLQRLPALLNQQNADGTPFASPAARSWFEEEILARPAPAATSSPLAVPDESVSRARALLKEGKAAEGIALLQGDISSSRSSREKFALRLAQAKLCAEGGQLAVARGLYAALDRECVQRGLDEWEPALAIECLEGLLTCARIVGKALPADLAGQYHRLCQLDPAVALRVGSERT